MKHVTYSKRDIAGKGRVVSIRESQEDKESVTRVVKNFVYFINRADCFPEQEAAPQIRLTKKIATDEHSEVFIFKVKGIMHVKERRLVFAVQYCHSLVVKLFWKSPAVASKPAALA
jgi:hypothetical protein